MSDWSSDVCSSDLPRAGTISLPGQKRFNSFTPRVALDYQVTPDMLLYASWSKGFKSGTYNLVTLGNPLNPEKVSAFSGVIKSTLFDRRLRFHFAVFYYFYSVLLLVIFVILSTFLVISSTSPFYFSFFS